MFILHGYVHVKPGCVDAFREATLENASHSVQEPGVTRFDLLQECGDPAKFVILEEYRVPEDHGRHRETKHYEKWRDTVGDMMAEPLRLVEYQHHPGTGCLAGS